MCFDYYHILELSLIIKETFQCRVYTAIISSSILHQFTPTLTTGRKGMKKIQFTFSVQV